MHGRDFVLPDDVVELVMEFEDVFKITIPDEDYEKIKTVGDAVKYIEEKQ